MGGGVVAWFQASSATPDPDHLVEAGSSDFSINSVDGLKSVRQVDSDGYLTIAGDENSIARQSATESDTTNTGNTTAHTDFDVPHDGVGYYVVFSDSDYKYSGGYKMATDSTLVYGSPVNKLVIKNVTLTQNTYFDIRRHYFDAGGQTKDEFCTEVSATDSSGLNGAARVEDPDHNNDSHWKFVGATGQYDIYVNNSTKLYVKATETLSSRAGTSSIVEDDLAPESSVSGKRAEENVKAKRGGATPKKAYTGTTRRIYLDISSYNWWDDQDDSQNTARIHYWGGSSSSSWPGVMMNIQTANSLLYYDVPIDTTSIIFLRCKHNAGDPYNNENRTGDISLQGDKNQWKITGGSSGNYKTGSWSYRSVSTDGYYVFGSFNSWSRSDAYKMTPDYKDGDFTNAAAITSITIPASATFKVVKIYCDVPTYYGGLGTTYTFASSTSGSDVTVSVHGNYKIFLSQNANDKIYMVQNYWIASLTLDDQNSGNSSTTHTITANSGSAMPALTATSPALAATGPTRTGYTFGGYYTAKNGGGTQYYTSTGASAKNCDLATGTTLYAKWTADSYTLSYNLNGGTLGSANPSSYTIESSAITLNNPTKTGHTFAGWTGTGLASATTTVTIPAGSTGNRSYAATWTANTYDVTLNKNGGTITSGNVTSYTYGVGATLPTSITKDGYDFVGWYTNSSFTGDPVTSIGTTETGAKEYWARWTLGTYTITFDKNGGSIAAPSNLTPDVGSSVTFPSYAGTKTGYTFVGWNTANDGSGNRYTGTMTPGNAKNTTLALYAEWSINSYTVSATPGQGVSSVYFSTANNATSGAGTSFNYNTTVYVYAELRAGWSPGVGWTQIGATNKYRVTSHTLGASNYDFGTIAAVTQAYTITVNLDGGNVASANPTSYNVSASAGSIVLQTPTKTGYTFGGYSKTSGPTSGTVSLSSGNTFSVAANTYGNVTFTASWTANEYTVVFDKNGGSGDDMDDQDFVYDEAQNLSANSYERTGYTFDGWATSPGGGKAYDDGEEVENLTATDGATVILYAHWNPKTTSITLNANGGSNGNKTSVTGTYDSDMPALTSDGNLPTRTGYTFAGYYDTSAVSGGTKYYNADGSSARTWNKTDSSTILYARWTADTYTIKFNGNGSTGGSTSSVTATYDSRRVLTSNGFTKTGYHFIGWATSAGGSVVYTDGQNLTVSQVNTHYGAPGVGSGGTFNLYAKWEANSYEVRFNANGGTGTMSNESFTYGSSKALTSNAFTKTGYNFAGWATSDSGPVVYTNGQSVSNLTTTNNGVVDLYAKWTPKTYNIVWNLNGGTGGPTGTTTATYDAAKPTITNKYTPLKAGYAFLGFYTTAGGGTKYYDEDLNAVSGNWTHDSVNLYAHWQSATLNSSNTIYAVCDASYSGNLYLYAWGSSWRYFVQMSAASGYSNVYSATVPTEATGFLFYGGSAGQVNTSCQSTNIKDSSSFQSDSYSGTKVSSGITRDLVYIHNTTIGGDGGEKNKYKWEWVKYSSAPSNSGYYITPVNSGTGSWTASGKMDHMSTQAIATKFIYATTGTDYQFQVWCFTSDNKWVICGVTKLGSLSDFTNPQTNIAKISVAGKYNIYYVADGATERGIFVEKTQTAEIVFTKRNGVSLSPGNYEIYEMNAANSSQNESLHGFPALGETVGTPNRFYNDESLAMKGGDTFYIRYIHGATDEIQGPTGDHVVAIHSNSTSYVTNDSNLYKIVGDSDESFRYTFYWTADSPNKIAVAPVPVLGNGYYIMSQGAINKNTGYKNGSKMATNSIGGGAYYTGYYSSGNQVNFDSADGSGTKNANTIFIRSYVNSVDTLITSITIDSRISSKAKIVSGGSNADGVVRLKEGFYNIRVSGTSAYISAFTTSDQFALDRLVSGKSVQNNYTSIVYEIAYTLAQKDVPVKLSAQALNIGSYMDWMFYAPSERITSYINSEEVLREDNPTSPYYKMRQLYFGTTFSSDADRVVSEVITKTSDDQVFYCYIIVDYKKNISGSVPTIITDSVNFRITCTQYVAPVASSSAAVIEMPIYKDQEARA